MGLDTYLEVRKKLNDKERMCINLGSKKPKNKSVCYWRKCWEIVEFFGEVLGNIENVTEYMVTKEQLEEIYRLSQDEQIKKALKEIDWETQEVIFYKVIFYNWW